MERPLVEPTSVQDDKAFQDLILFFNETLGFCPNSVKTMYHRPAIANAFIALNQAVMENKGRVTSDLKRMVGYVSSHAAGCRYCQAHTIRAAVRYGAADEKLRNIWSFQTHPAFSTAERAALSFAIAASSIPNQVNETLAKEMRSHWDEGEIVEILGVVALFGYLNRWNDSMATQLELDAIQSDEQYLLTEGWTPGKHHIQ